MFPASLQSELCILAWKQPPDAAVIGHHCGHGPLGAVSRGSVSPATSPGKVEKLRKHNTSLNMHNPLQLPCSGWDQTEHH